MTRSKLKHAWLIASGLLLAGIAGCSGGTSQQNGGGQTVIRVEGSDTLVNLAQAWAEVYNKTHPNVSIQVSGGGSGVGIASLIDGVADMANASRDMKDKEIKLAEQNTGKTPQEHVVALDALAVYVHRDNPLDTIALPQLAEIYGEGGTVTTWGQLGVENTACKSGEITRVSRQNNSGTYHYFREVVLGVNRDLKLGSIDQSGSKDVVALVSRTPCAIGYSGMGFKTDEVKWLEIAKSAGDEAVEPSVATAKDGSYPLARPLLIYTLGDPTGAVKDYLDWILSDDGQQIVIDLGYVPVNGAGDDSARSDETAEDETAEDETAEESSAEPTNQSTDSEG